MEKVNIMKKGERGRKIGRQKTRLTNTITNVYIYVILQFCMSCLLSKKTRFHTTSGSGKK